MQIYIAPGGHHLIVERNGAQQYACRLNDGERDNRHKPSVMWWMHDAAAKLGVADSELPLENIVDKLVTLSRQ